MLNDNQSTIFTSCFTKIINCFRCCFKTHRQQDGEQYEGGSLSKVSAVEIISNQLNIDHNMDGSMSMHDNISGHDSNIMNDCEAY